jgi:PAS domain S-box-containing protein
MAMMDAPIKILLVEDNPGDARLIQEMLADAGAQGVTSEWVPRLSQGLECLDQGEIDLVLLDLNLPDSHGLDTFFKAYAHAPEIPFVILTGLDDETLALTAVRQGAQDYLVKGETDANKLFRAIRYATERKRVQEALRRARDELERRVAERTAELLAANRQLQEEIARRRQTEAALAAERQRLYDVLEMLPVYVVLLTHDYGVPFANRTFRERFGESQGRRCYEYLFGRQEPCEFCQSYHVLKTGKPQEWEWTGPDNRDYQIFDFPFTDSDGSPLILEMGIDITERKQATKDLRLAHDNLELKVALRTAELAKANQELQEEIEERKRAEEALHRQQEEQQIILDSVPAMIFYKDTDNRVIRVNRALADLTGLPVEEIEGKPVSETFPNQAENFWEDDWEVITTGYPKRNIIEPVQTPMGIRWVQTDKLPYSDEKGNIIGVIGFSMDITERKQAEAALKESEERFRTIFEDAAIGICLADLEGRIITGNLALQRMMGCPADELIGKTFMEITHPDDLERNLEFFHDLLAGRLEQYQLEKRYRRPDGQYFWARVTVSSVKGAGNVPLYNIAMIEDITQRKQAQENLRESEQNLRYLASQLMTAQERERERISRELHDELGQALLVMKLQASYIERGLAQEQGAIRRECQALLQHLDQLVEEIRRLARDLSPTMVRDLGLSSALLQLVKEFTRHYDIEADIDQMENINDLFPRQAQINIYRIFQEALTNIGKYAQASQLRIAIKREDSQVSFLMADNGKGFKVDEVLGGDQTRRGLGLMAMKERARMMGGTLEIWSQEGEGTRIALIIPIGDRKVAQGGT